MAIGTEPAITILPLMVKQRIAILRVRVTFISLISNRSYSFSQILPPTKKNPTKREKEAKNESAQVTPHVF